MDARVSFPTLEGASGEGLALRSVEVGDSPTGKRGSIALGFRDSSGNLVLPQLTPAGRLPVDTEGNNGSWMQDRGEDPDGSASGTFADIAEIVLANDDVIDELNYTVSGRKGGLFQVCLDDNGVISVLEDVILEAGQLTHSNSVKTEVTAGSTGTQRLLIRAFNWDTAPAQLSPLRASLRALVRA